ncbi:hypothetical protein I7I48_12190 [Histoplasma ohiense]|nr:hypothetical protein I7I48_12190 [Histoplasma ohiense (nom. inval.)]
MHAAISERIRVAHCMSRNVGGIFYIVRLWEAVLKNSATDCDLLYSVPCARTRNLLVYLNEH